jgi:hypothetical protein
MILVVQMPGPAGRRIFIRFAGAILWVVALNALRCTSDNPPTIPVAQPSLSYTLSIPVMHPDSVSVSLKVSHGSTMPERYILPYIYNDNPIDTLAVALVEKVTIVDSTGASVAFETEKEFVGPIESTVITLPGSAKYPVEFSYRLRLPATAGDTGAAGQPVPSIHLNSREGLLIGAYLFMAPWEHSLPAIWRTPRDISLRVESGPGVNGIGIPPRTSFYANSYQLLFCQYALGATPLGQGSGAGQAYTIWAYPSDPDGPLGIGTIDRWFSRILDDIVPLYGRLDEESYPIIKRAIQGGLEGTQSFVFRSRIDPLDSSLAMIFAHEALHEFIGIRCGDIDDPWWKEGTTFYCGYATAARCGLLSGDLVKHTFADTSASVDSICGLYAPADDYLRAFMFAGGLWPIAYIKGGQIAMLMDLRIRTATGNRTRLDDVMAAFCRNRSAFHRNDFVLFVRATAGAAIADILLEYADQPGPIPIVIRKAVFDELDRLGAFGR